MSKDISNVSVERLTRRLDHMVPEPRMLATITSAEEVDAPETPGDDA
ncbi:hypothetical protein [Planobispora takensis]|uniref:Uncharacterized protein n=1 Tax=Planobispora takensis TaxID=1367882 RepID=A0A8J3SZ66_9ACTN|nr:hypothetical protein [Planobispora takensis]GIH98188.1 hypothetical protein Pta02_01970 [Planobispora takensis]